MKTVKSALFAVVLSIASVLILMGNSIPAYASDAGFFVYDDDPDNDYPEGARQFAKTYNKVTVNASGMWYIQSEDTTKYNGEYNKFQKYILFKQSGSINSLSLQTTVTQPTTLILFVLGGENSILTSQNRFVVRNFAKYNTDEHHGSLQPQGSSTVVKTDATNGDYYVLLNSPTSESVQKLVYNLPEAGTYHMYVKEGSVKIYAVYVGGISDDEARILGKQFDDRTIGEIKADAGAGPVFWISLAIFVLGVVAFAIMVNQKGGKGTFSALLSNGQKKPKDDISYKE